MPARNEYCETSSVQDLSVKIRARHFWNDTLATIGVLVAPIKLIASRAAIGALRVRGHNRVTATSWSLPLA